MKRMSDFGIYVILDKGLLEVEVEVEAMSTPMTEDVHNVDMPFSISRWLFSLAFYSLRVDHTKVDLSISMAFRQPSYGYYTVWLLARKEF